MRLISWNTNARSKRVAEQIAFLESRKPDIVALQEVTPNGVPHFRNGLQETGFQFILDGFEALPDQTVFTGPRGRGVLVASRYPGTSRRKKNFKIPWPEKILSISINGPNAKLDLHVTYIPSGASHGWIKAETLEGIYNGLARESKRPRILCGDFNAPQEEYPSGETVTWAQRFNANGEAVVRKRFRKGEGARWDAAERNIFEGLPKFDLPDVYRALNGWDDQGYSWIPIRRKIKYKGRRFDHIFASSSLNPVACWYLSEAREAGLSDHSPIEVDFDI